MKQANMVASKLRKYTFQDKKVAKSYFSPSLKILTILPSISMGVNNISTFCLSWSWLRAGVNDPESDSNWLVLAKLQYMNFYVYLWIDHPVYWLTLPLIFFRMDWYWSVYTFRYCLDLLLPVLDIFGLSRIINQRINWSLKTSYFCQYIFLWFIFTFYKIRTFI